MSSFPSDIIPPDWQRWSETRPSVIKALTGGLTNRSFLLNAGGDRLVLRRNSTISAALDLNRVAEHQALLHADNAGLCAPLIYCDPQHQYLVTRFIDGDTWSADGTGALPQLAQLLRGIHTLPPIDARLDIEDKAASYWCSIDNKADFYAPLRTLDKKVHRHTAAAQELSAGICLCHNDLLATNLIAAADGNLYAIDWEYAAMGDPFYELALIVTEYRLDQRQQQLLLAKYLDRPTTSVDWQRLDHWRVIYGYLSVLWYAVQWSSGSMRQPAVTDKIANTIRDVTGLSFAIDG